MGPGELRLSSMPGSLNYSPSGSEGGRSPGGDFADLDKSLVGVDLTTTPGTTPLRGRNRSSSRDGSVEGVSNSNAVVPKVSG